MIATDSAGPHVKKCLSVILLLLMVSAALPQQKNTMSLQQLTDSVQSIVKADHMPGVMLGITSKDSTIFSGGFGYADISTCRPANATTLFRLGSITKMFVSLAILQLVREGKLGLQDELKKDYDAKWTAEQRKRKVKEDIVFKAPAGYDDHLDHFTNFFDSIRTGKPVVEDAEFGFRAAAPALSCNASYFSKKIVHWDPVNMRLK